MKARYSYPVRVTIEDGQGHQTKKVILVQGFNWQDALTNLLWQYPNVLGWNRIDSAEDK